jgi:cytochrome d ubiquinol oxidase subunit II
MVSLIFADAFGTLAISFWPYVIPFSIAIVEAAAPRAWLSCFGEQACSCSRSC